MKSKIGLVVAIVAMLCLAGWSSKAQNSSEAAWEYKVVTVYGYPELPAPNVTQFNDLGVQRWELVSMFSEQTVRGSRTENKLFYYFKRRL